jgi:hypothetical protein
MIGGVDMDHVAKGHCGAGGGCGPSCAECEAETTSILQSEWEVHCNTKQLKMAKEILLLNLSPVTINI